MTVNGDFEDEHSTAAEASLLRDMIAERAHELGRLGLLLPAEIMPADAPIDKVALAYSGLALLVQALQEDRPATVRPEPLKVVLQPLETESEPESQVMQTTEHVLESEPEATSEGVLLANEQSRQFVAGILKTTSAELPPLTRQQVRLFGERIMTRYRSLIPTDSRKYNPDAQCERFALRLEGKTQAEVAGLTGVTQSTVSGSSQRIIDTLYFNGHREQLISDLEEAIAETGATMALSVIAPETTLEYKPEPQEPASPDPAEITENALSDEEREARNAAVFEQADVALPEAEVIQPESDDEAAFPRKIIDIVKDSWSDEEQASLKELLNNEQSPKNLLALMQIQTLLQNFAPFDPARNGANALLSPLEWQTLNLLSGFRLGQGEVARLPRFLIPRLAFKYERAETSFEDMLESGLQKLIDVAKADLQREQGLLSDGGGEIPTAPKGEQNSKEGASEPEINPTIEQTIKRRVMSILGKTPLLTVDQKNDMGRHLSGEPVNTGSQGFIIAARKMREAVADYKEYYRKASFTGKQVGELKLDWLFDALLGRGNVASAMTLQTIHAERRKNTSLAQEQLDDLKKVILHNLTLIERRRH